MVGARRTSTRSRSWAGASPSERYFADEGLLTAVHLALVLGRPLALEGEPGVGKTELAKVLADVLGRELIRLQCYEGLDAGQALYEWDYPKQLLAVRVAEAEGARGRRPLRRALPARAPAAADGARRRGRRAADRRDRPLGLRVRGVPARVPVRLPDHDPGGRDAARRAAAGRRAHVEPHARAARRAQAPLPLPLDPVPGRRARAGDPARAGARARRGGGRRARRGDQARARREAAQAPGDRGDDRLGAGRADARARGGRRGRRRCAARSGCCSRSRRTSSASPRSTWATDARVRGGCAARAPARRSCARSRTRASPSRRRRRRTSSSRSSRRRRRTSTRCTGARG